MKSVVSIAALCAFLCLGLSAAFVSAADTKEVTLKGTALCGKCELKQDAKCNCILKVTADGKDTLYYLSGKVNHKADFCQGTKELTVTGVVTEKEGKHFMKVSKTE